MSLSMWICRKKVKKVAFFNFMLLHFIFCKIECVIIHFISIIYSKIDILHFSEIIKLHSILNRFENIWIFVEIMLKNVHTCFCYVNEDFEFCNIWPYLLQ